jgi:hypothetical protein
MKLRAVRSAGQFCFRERPGGRFLQVWVVRSARSSATLSGDALVDRRKPRSDQPSQNLPVKAPAHGGPLPIQLIDIRRLWTKRFSSSTGGCRNSPQGPPLKKNSPVHDLANRGQGRLLVGPVLPYLRTLTLADSYRIEGSVLLHSR